MAPNAFGADSGSHSSPTTSVGLTERPERPAAPSSVSRLTAWRVSSKNAKQLEYLKRLQSCSWQAGAQVQTRPTSQDGTNG